LNITITCRHEFKTDDVKNYALEKVKKLDKYYNNITKIEVVLNSVKEQHSAEAVISVSRGTRLVGRALHEDARAAVDLVVDKMERQLVRFKERLKDRRGGRRGEEPELTEDSEDIEDADADD
jgi:putative sigma-54 modulation protein